MLDPAASHPAGEGRWWRPTRLRAGAGCYGLQIDGLRFSQVLVVELGQLGWLTGTGGPRPCSAGRWPRKPFQGALLGQHRQVGGRQHERWSSSGQAVPATSATPT